MVQITGNEVGWGGRWGLAATFGLADFLVSTSASKKKSVNHLRTLPRMGLTRK